MKGIFMSFAFFVMASIVFNEAWSIENTSKELELLVEKSENIMNDGWYTAKVTYSNHQKLSKTISKLKVQVQNDKVIKIQLTNGKILEATKEHSDYYYSGGVLNFEFDLHIKEKLAKTAVKIKEENGNLSFYDIAIL